MKDRKAVQVRLSKPEQRRLDELLRGGLQPVRTVLRALVYDNWRMGKRFAR